MLLERRIDVSHIIDDRKGLIPFSDSQRRYSKIKSTFFLYFFILKWVGILCLLPVCKYDTGDFLPFKM